MNQFPIRRDCGPWDSDKRSESSKVIIENIENQNVGGPVHKQLFEISTSAENQSNLFGSSTKNACSSYLQTLFMDRAPALKIIP